MKRIDKATAQKIIDTAEIVDVVSDFVSLKKRGSGYIGLCPFHNERTPSFSVSPSKGICKCFSCGKGGSPVNFIMELEKLSYQDALRYLARKYHIEIQERELTDEEMRQETERESMLAINEWALGFFEKSMNDTDEGRDIGRSYFMERGLNGLMIEKFHLGYAPDSYDALYKAAIEAGYTEQFLLATGLCAKTENGKIYDRFRGRVIYPVFSRSGKVVAFGGRTLRSDKKMAKYVNSPESIIYSKSNELYGLYQAKNAIVNQDSVYLVEGYMDVISMFQSGVENVVASSGTSLTSGQIHLLRRFTKNVTVVYDTDAAGIKASLRGIDMLLKEGMQVKILQFPDGDDPDSYARTHTSEELLEYLDSNKVDFIHFKTSILLKGAENDPIRRAQVITDVCRSIAVIPDLISRTVYIGETSRMLNIDEKVVALQVSKEIANHTESANKEQRLQEAQASLGDTNVSAAQPATNTTATSTASSRERSSATEFLAPYEREILRYILRYGMVLLPMYDENENPIDTTVIEFVEQERQLDDLSFKTPEVAHTYELVQKLIREEWEEAYAKFRHSLIGMEETWRKEGEAEIAEITGGPDALSAAEIRLNERIKELRAEAEVEFRNSFIAKSFISIDDDTARVLANDLVIDRYKLSTVHSRYGQLPSERDRLEELLPRVIYEWKDAILDVDIKQINDQIAQTGIPIEEIRELLKKKMELLNLKREFAKYLGERIIAPRNIK